MYSWRPDATLGFCLLHVAEICIGGEGPLQGCGSQSAFMLLSKACTLVPSEDVVLR